MSERSVRRWTYGAAFMACILFVIAMSIAPVAADAGKRPIESGDQGSIIADARVGAPASSLESSTSVADRWNAAGVQDQAFSTGTLSQSNATEGKPGKFALQPATPNGTESVEAACNAIVPVLNHNGFFVQTARCPVAIARFARGKYLLLPSEVIASGMASGLPVTGIGWTYYFAPGVAATAPLKIYLQNTTDTVRDPNTNWATMIAPMTLVHDAATALPNAAVQFNIPFTGGAGFTYTGSGLYVAWDWGQYTGTLAVPGPSTAPVGILINNAQGPLGFFAVNDVAAPATVNTSSANRPETRLLAGVNVPDDDVSVDQVRSYGVLPRDLAGGQVIQAVISNQGATPKTNLPVSLNVAGSMTFSNTQNVASLPACGGEATVTFVTFSPGAYGSNTVSASVPADLNTANDTLSVPMDITTKDYSFKHPGTTADGGVGLTGGTGAFVGRFTVRARTTVSAVTLEFPAPISATTYRVAIYANTGSNLPGLELYSDAADRTVLAPGPVTIILPTPIVVGPGSFYAGIKQTNTTNAGLSFDDEDPLRTGKFYLATALPPTAWVDLSPNPFKMNIGVVVDPCYNLGAACDDTNLCTDDSCDPLTGCEHAPASCDDFDACSNDLCDPEFGCNYEPVNCDDANPCTDDSCISQALVPNGCTVADDGSGTVTLPPLGCTYLSPADVHEIRDGLPPGTTIKLGAAHRDFICHGPVGGGQGSVCDFVPSPECDKPGGDLGGREECAESSLQLTLEGTGGLAGWNRTLNLPVSFQTHVGPRTPGSPLQSFPTDMFRLMGQLPPGDPDFDLLKITGGTDFGLPSPGHTTLRQASPPNGPWTVDSFFDITYTIEYQGKAGGHIGGMSGSTTATIRMSTGNGVGCVHPPANCDDANACTVDACDTLKGCTHTAVTCNDGNVCTTDSCDPSLGCTATPISCDDGQICTADSCDPLSGCIHTTLNCDDNDPCTTDACVQTLTKTAPCVVADNGAGTVTLPPANCSYLSPSDVHEIIDGLPAGTTVELTGIHHDFVCNRGSNGTPPGVCDFVPSPSCDVPGGDLGGRKECADSSLTLGLKGGGGLAGWNRTINLPVAFETHVATRTPGAPVQSFDTDMFRLLGQLPAGDPDFDLLRITAGTDFGLPSPGHTTLTRLASGSFAVDSFFDITYTIEFTGASGGHLSGRSGSTTATIRMSTGAGISCSHTSLAPTAEASGVVLNGHVTTQIDWSPAPGTTTSDVVRGLLPALPVGPGGGDEVCLDNNNPGTSTSDGAIPLVGEGFWYLVRGSNACGSGPYGTQGFHGTPSTPRVTNTCP